MMIYLNKSLSLVGGERIYVFIRFSGPRKGGRSQVLVVRRKTKDLRLPLPPLTCMYSSTARLFAFTWVFKEYLYLRKLPPSPEREKIMCIGRMFSDSEIHEMLKKCEILEGIGTGGLGGTEGPEGGLGGLGG